MQRTAVKLPARYATRVMALRAIMDGLGFDVVILSDPANLRFYLDREDGAFFVAASGVFEAAPEDAARIGRDTDGVLAPHIRRQVLDGDAAYAAKP